jgi:hypothetical protein
VVYGRRTAKAVAAPVATPAPGGGAAALGGPGGAGALSGQGSQGNPGGQQGGQAAGQAQQGGAQARATAGTVEKVEGNVLTVRTIAGSSATVNLSGDTELRQSVSAQVSDLTAGQTVTITGATAADGSIQARSITIGPLGAAAGGGAGGQGGQRAQPSATAGGGR